MWNHVFNQWIDLTFWWLPQKEKDHAKDVAAPAPTVTERQVKQPPAPKQQRTADDLTVIKGIGPAVQEKLQALDIKTFGDLVDADPKALSDTLKQSLPMSVERVRAWAEAARGHAPA